MSTHLQRGQISLINKLVKHYEQNKQPFEVALKGILNYVEASERFKGLIHSVKYRLKDPDHLRDKLVRKFTEARKKGEELTINIDNLFSKINDLAGFRIIHLHTKQFEEINTELHNFFRNQNWIVVKKPSARTWDDESREYFKSIGIGVDKSPNLYTSVHYIIKPNNRTNITCEIQVRTLMEEVWGEVDHTINYPHKSLSLSCREQIKALARATSTSSRLVDSIFASHADFIFNEQKKHLRKKGTKKTISGRK